MHDGKQYIVVGVMFINEVQKTDGASPSNSKTFIPQRGDVILFIYYCYIFLLFTKCTYSFKFNIGKIFIYFLKLSFKLN